MNTALIINSSQADILRFLAGVKDATGEWILVSVKLSRSRYGIESRDLRDRGLVSAKKETTGMSMLRLSITDTGRQALDEYTSRYHLPDAPEAPPPVRTSPLEGQYIPNKNAYCRNDGHTHLPSRGIGA